MTNDASTSGMESGYSLHDAYQRQVASSSADALREAALQAAGALAADTPFVIADYGCSTNPHAAMIREAIACVRSRSNAEIVVVHNDLPTNDWNALLRAATDPKLGYADEGDSSPMTLVSAGSFFEPVLPRGSVHLGMSFSAAHWLRSQPVARAGSWCIADAAEPACGPLEAQAAEDWERFLSLRAQELAPGGVLLIECIGTEVDPRTGQRFVTSAELLELMRATALEFASEGRLDRSAVESFVFPTAMRDVAQAGAPLQGPLGRLLDACDVSVHRVDNPYLPLVATAGAAEYAREYVAFVRAFSASTLRAHLFEHLANPDASLDDYFSRLEKTIARDPSLGVFKDWTLRVVLRRRL